MFIRFTNNNKYYMNCQEKQVSDTYVKKDDLPSPYEPTLMIGDNKFEDVNLLSNVVKYQLFANKSKDNNGLITYRLPTHYDEKNTEFYNQKIINDFYKGRYDDFRSFLYFRKVSENFHGNMEEEEYGAIRTNSK